MAIAAPTRSLPSRMTAGSVAVVLALIASLLTLATQTASATLVGPEGAHAVDLDVHPSGEGVWVVDELGRVYANGLPHLGELGSDSLVPGERIVAIHATPTGSGYWPHRPVLPGALSAKSTKRSTP